MKKEIRTIDAAPSKRLFASIIADYDLNRSMCELVDNVLDIWLKGGKSHAVHVNIALDQDQQTIRVADNAGGVREADLDIIVSPGQTTNDPTDRTIGIFGVGTKRAVVALAQSVTITTRCGEERTYMVEFGDQWLAEERWELQVYEVDNIDEGMTVIELQKLRFKVTDDAVSRLREHLGVTYAKFLTNDEVRITVNSDPLEPAAFDRWAYPPGYSPRRYVGKLKTPDTGTVDVEIVAGLTTVSSPAGGEYGVYFYCNDRLIARGLKTFEVGFTKGLAGQPHPSVSLARVIVSLRGQAQTMPWNSSKSGINTNHAVFTALRPLLVEVVKDYASLSRRLEGSWHTTVFPYTSGNTVAVRIADFAQAKKSYLPPLPVAKPRYGYLVKQANKAVSQKKPWTKGIYEGMIAADLVLKQKFDEKNRIALLLLDSTLEIAFKEFLVNDSGEVYGDRRLLDLFNNRHAVHCEVKKHVDLDDDMWKKLEYYYRLRCSLVHQRATARIDDSEIGNFRWVVETVLSKLFGLTLHM